MAAHQVPTKAQENAKSVYQKLKDRARRTGPLGWAGIVAAAALLASGTVIGLIVLTPVFVIFSPILVPLGIILFLCTAGIFVFAGIPIISLSGITWLCRYYKGKHPVGSGKVDYAVSRMHESVKEVAQKTTEVASRVQSKAQEPIAAA